MSRETMQIRLAQPPIYLMGVVILASLLPLFVQLFGGAADGVERLRRLAFAGISVPQVEPPEAAAVAVDEDEDEVEIVEDEVLVEVVEVESVAPVAKKRSSRAKPSVTAKAKAACARQDRDAARAAYKSLERGDPRRKEIRKACRNAGVWFL